MHDKLVRSAYLHQMHPDLFEATEEIEYVLRCFKDRDDLQKKQEFWLEAHAAGIPLPNKCLTTFSTHSDVTKKNDKHEIDVDATTKELARVIQWARSKGYTIRKEYTELYFYIHVTADRIRYDFVADRQVYCKKVYRGTKVVEAQPESVVDVYDWECEKVAFTTIEVDNAN